MVRKAPVGSSAERDLVFDVELLAITCDACGRRSADVAGRSAGRWHEDVGAGDLTAALVPADAVRVPRSSCVNRRCCAADAVVRRVFRQLDAAIRVDWSADDGDPGCGTTCLHRAGDAARPVLSGERTALNFLQTLSGTASRAARTSPQSPARRRPSWIRARPSRAASGTKYAVRCGGASNHRVGLFDAVLIKENHIRAAGSIAAAAYPGCSDIGRRDGRNRGRGPGRTGSGAGAGATRICSIISSASCVHEAVLRQGGRNWGLGRRQSGDACEIARWR